MILRGFKNFSSFLPAPARYAAIALLLLLATVLLGCVGGGAEPKSRANENTYARVGFSGTAKTVSEYDGAITVPVALSTSLRYSAKVQYSVSGGTAVYGTDYTGARNGTLTFNPGVTTVNIPLTVIDNGDDESNRTISLRITSAGPDLTITSSTFVITIADDDGLDAVNFSTAAQTAAEGATVTVTAQIGVAKSFGITVPLLFSGTALEGYDYSVSGETISIPAGSTSGSITVTLPNDTIQDGTKTLTVTMDEPTNAEFGSIVAQSITITDGGGSAIPTLAFTVGSQIVTEADGTVTATLNLSGAVGADVAVSFSLSGSTATGAGEDFTQNNTSVVFSAGETSKTISFTIVDDADSEDTETIVVTPVNVINATLAGLTTHTISITDNEAGAFNVTSVYPNHGPTIGGNRVTLYGSGFENGDTTVAIGGTTCSSVEFITVNEINCTAGAGAAGVSNVVATDVSTVTSTTLLNGYTYTAWTATDTTSQPAARYGHTAIWTGGEMIVWGGEDAGTYYGNGGRYNPATDSWTAVAAGASNEPSTRSYHTAVWTGVEMIIWGGTSGGSYFSDGGRYNPVLGTWSAVASSGLNGRANHTAVYAPTSTGNEMIVWGGQGVSGLFNNGSAYNVVANTWSALTATSAPAARMSHTAVVGIVSGAYQMIIWGGKNGTTALNTGAMLRLNGKTWTSTSVTGVPAARFGHSAVWADTRMIVFGGEDYSSCCKTDGGMFTPTASGTGQGTWAATTIAATGRAYHSAIWSGTEMVVWGGVDSTNTNLSTGVRLNPSTSSWSASFSASGAVPAARESHSVVWTGARMIVWGGYNGSALGTGASLIVPSPSANTWSATATPAAAVHARHSHTAVWTGSEMVVWGGVTTGDTCVNSGGKYNPVANSWVTMATGPTARCDHVAVWNGVHMLVWGGRSGGTTALKDGRRYNPVTNAWTATSDFINVAPATITARYGHKAVWTGSRLIIWGGFNGSYLNTGYMYNPTGTTAANSWSVISATSAPTARYGHSAVWTGSRMLVWGGYNGTTYYNTGGVYNPVTDTWTAITAGATARIGHSTVWTGTHMIVWGGFDGSAYTSTGYKYNFASDSWTALSATLAPTARSNHTAVWTGEYMIVWGGTSGSGAVNSGAAYHFASDTWAKLTSRASTLPAERARHSAVWTGTRMVIWGGTDSSTTLSTGGIFIP